MKKSLLLTLSNAKPLRFLLPGHANFSLARITEKTSALSQELDILKLSLCSCFVKCPFKLQATRMGRLLFLYNLIP